MRYAYTNKFIQFLAIIIDFVGGILFLSFLKKKRFRPQNIRKILIVKLDHFGDCFLSTPVFEYINKIFPKAVTDLICQEITAPIFENNPFIRNIIRFNYFKTVRLGKRTDFYETLNFVKKMRRLRYDLYIDLRGETFVGLLGFLIGAKYRIGFQKEEAGSFFYHYPLTYNRDHHEIEKYKIILKFLGNIDTTKWLPKIYLSEKENRKLNDLVKINFQKPIIAFGIGAGLPYKIWPAKNFAVLINKIYNNKSDYDFILLGDDNDRLLAKEILEQVKIKNIFDLTGRLSIRESYGLLSKSKAFIGNDSALAHFAGALGILTIELMNASISATRWAPLGKNIRIIKGIDSNHTCAYDNCYFPCPNMQAIKVDCVRDEVFRALN